MTILAACMAVYSTPHTFVMTPRELLQMGGQQHQVLGNYGVESAKNTAINIMMVVTMWSFILWGKSRFRNASHSIDRFIAVAFLAGAAVLHALPDFTFNDVWAFVQWAQKSYPDLDLASRPTASACRRLCRG